MKKFNQQDVDEVKGGILVSFIIILGIGGIGLTALYNLLLAIFL